MVPEVCHELRRKLNAFLTEKPEDKVLRDVQSQVQVSMKVIEKALSRYGPEQLSISYNGGKDCVVLLVLILACLPVWAFSSDPSPAASSNLSATLQTSTAKHPIKSPSQPPSSKPAVSPRSLQAVYIISEHPFAEVETFVEASATGYSLDLDRYALPMRPGLEAYLLDKPKVEGIFVGTRRTDPHGETLTHFDPTDKDWPQFMRIHPVIDWHYVEIWAFIRHLDIPFCSLYSQGFTSLGGMYDTHPNPALAVEGDPTKFRPAYELVEDGEERLGRDR
ncbi:hypothetical protein BJ878DRAFT_425687 [Calycina marina]|uniref:FAD synthase n=1 Tax=Calycina marina TaxID=1763456 RepID=A0A9P8CDA3_9HELO|nr:hypothetical protein BJ878DRAFT_425687 [Calycina marina]